MSKKKYTGDFKFKSDVLDAVVECDIGYSPDDLAWAYSEQGEYELTEAERWVQRRKEEEGEKLDRQRFLVIEKYIEEKRIEYGKTGKKADKCALCVKLPLGNRYVIRGMIVFDSYNCPNKYCKNYK